MSNDGDAVILKYGRRRIGKKMSIKSEVHWDGGVGGVVPHFYLQKGDASPLKARSAT